jgi:hypothetical protein
MSGRENDRHREADDEQEQTTVLDGLKNAFCQATDGGP